MNGSEENVRHVLQLRGIEAKCDEVVHSSGISLLKVELEDTADITQAADLLSSEVQDRGVIVRRPRPGNTVDVILVYTMRISLDGVSSVGTRHTLSATVGKDQYKTFETMVMCEALRSGLGVPSLSERVATYKEGRRDSAKQVLEDLKATGYWQEEQLDHPTFARSFCEVHHDEQVFLPQDTPIYADSTGMELAADGQLKSCSSVPYHVEKREGDRMLVIPSPFYSYPVVETFVYKWKEPAWVDEKHALCLPPPRIDPEAVRRVALRREAMMDITAVQALAMYSCFNAKNAQGNEETYVFRCPTYKKRDALNKKPANNHHYHIRGIFRTTKDHYFENLAPDRQLKFEAENAVSGVRVSLPLPLPFPLSKQEVEEQIREGVTCRLTVKGHLPRRFFNGPSSAHLTLAYIPQNQVYHLPTRIPQGEQARTYWKYLGGSHETDLLWTFAVTEKWLTTQCVEHTGLLMGYVLLEELDSQQIRNLQDFKPQALNT